MDIMKMEWKTVCSECEMEAEYLFYKSNLLSGNKLRMACEEHRLDMRKELFGW